MFKKSYGIIHIHPWISFGIEVVFSECLFSFLLPVLLPVWFFKEVSLVCSPLRTSAWWRQLIGLKVKFIVSISWKPDVSWASGSLSWFTGKSQIIRAGNHSKILQTFSTLQLANMRLMASRESQCWSHRKKKKGTENKEKPFSSLSGDRGSLWCHVAKYFQGPAVVQWLSHVWLFFDPIDYSTSGFPVLHHLPEFAQTRVTESVMTSNHLILCPPLLLLPSIFPSIRVFSNESALHIRWWKYWSFSFSISPFNEYSGFISFRIDWLDLLAVQGTLKGLLQQHS